MVSPSKIRAPAEPAIRAADAAFLGGGEGGGCAQTQERKHYRIGRRLKIRRVRAAGPDLQQFFKRFES